MKRSLLIQFLLLSLFAIAMGFLESSVVIYLREIYYPEGFTFPLKIIEGKIATTEILREAATILMLFAMSMIGARRWIIRFAWFIFLFAVWDIFYYIFLWLILGWPESLLTWDILFLIPTTWVGPVIAPVINSLTMILLAIVLIGADRRTGGQADGLTGGQADKRTSGQIRMSGWEWGLLVVGSVITMVAYMEDYTRYMLHRFPFTDWIFLKNKSAILEYSGTFVPVSFNWWLFLSGTILFLLCIFLFSMRSFSSIKNKHI